MSQNTGFSPSILIFLSLSAAICGDFPSLEVDGHTKSFQCLPQKAKQHFLSPSLGHKNRILSLVNKINLMRTNTCGCIMPQESGEQESFQHCHIVVEFGELGVCAEVPQNSYSSPELRLRQQSKYSSPKAL